ncbi:MAG: fimbrillin family protein [Bacteroidales bacterium]|nr:fimbrillin family protein [Bacteroidales bacterium]
MKRNIYIIGMVVASLMLLTGCVKEDVTWSIANIAFRPLIGNDTRAMESVPFPDDQSFNVWSVSETTGETYLEGETISFSSDGWMSSKLWTFDGMYFDAFWPTDLPMEHSPVDGLQLWGFDCSDGDVDILVASAYGNSEQDDVVILRFDHILSRVEFRMLHSLPDDMSMRVKNIRMVGFAAVGDYNTTKKGDWETAENDFSYVVYDAAGGEGIEIEAGTTQYIGEEFYVIPQPCVASLEVEYEVRYGTANWIPQTETIRSLSTYWEPGKHYTYTLNLRLDKLTHTTGISSWNNR